MNGDLKLRLTPISEMSKEDSDFLRFLVTELSRETMLGVYKPETVTIDVKLRPIENGEDDSAYMLGDGSDFEVVIDNRMPFGMCVDFLIHELAHVHSWERACDVEDHCDEYGKSYALLYRKYLELYDLFWN